MKTSLIEPLLPSAFCAHLSSDGEFRSPLLDFYDQRRFLVALTCIGRQSCTRRSSALSVSSSSTRVDFSCLFSGSLNVLDLAGAGHASLTLKNSTDGQKTEAFRVEHSSATEKKTTDSRKDYYNLILTEDGASSSDTDDDASDDEMDNIVYNLNEMVALEDDNAESQMEDEDDSLEGASGDRVVDKGERRKRFEELCERKLIDENFVITLDDLCSLYEFRIDKFQCLAIEAFLNGSSVVVCAPTSSGKTLIAESAAAATLAMGRRLFYTTPLKALSNQKLREFRDMFGEKNVGLLTGDATVNRDAPILIMTTEILRNMLYQIVGTREEGGLFQDVSVFVLDEVHYLSDISRGTVWEETVIYCPKEVQLICLSATVPNSDELAGWIAQVHGATELITSRRRPVPLSWHFSTRYDLSSLLNEEGTAMNRRLSLTESHEDLVGDGTGENGKLKHSKGNDATFQNRVEHKGRRKKNSQKEESPTVSDEEMQFLRRKQVPRVEETLQQLKEKGMLPAIWFMFSRRGCDTAIHYMRDAQLLSNEECIQVYEALAAFKKEFPEAVRESSVSSLLRGFASHHAGCLPLWKAFIEDLFQRGLVKVVFATETLAAGINMPARTTVLSSLSKRGDSGHSLLSSNAMLQMAGRAGRRGLDERGHVVVVQTPFEGAEEACKLLFAGPDPLISQFSASYGMVLNLLSSLKSPDGKILRHGRTLEEARALIEQSFGNYVGSDVKVDAMREVSKLQERIVKLQGELIPDARSRLTEEEIDEYMTVKKLTKVERQRLRVLRRQLDYKRLAVMQPLLVESLKEHLPFIRIQYNDAQSGDEQTVSAMCIDILPLESSNRLRQALVNSAHSEDGDDAESISTMETSSLRKDEVLYFVALGSDNRPYAFNAISVQGISRTGLSNSQANPNEAQVRSMLMGKIAGQFNAWKVVGKSGGISLSSVWSFESSVDTWSWSTNVPRRSITTEEFQISQELFEAEQLYKEQRKTIADGKRKLRGTKASKEYWHVIALEKLREAKIAQLEAKKSRIIARINQLQPSGWKEFLQVVKVLEDVGAITSNPHEMLPLGETAAAFRGVNELWLALAFSNQKLVDLKPAQLASVCASFVSEGIKIRSDIGLSDIYTPSSAVEEAVDFLTEQREWLLEMQHKHGVSITCELDDQLAGLVEAWASGVTWKELMVDSGMDDGDLARLLRRSIDLLVQLPLIPHMDPQLQKTAKAAADVMDRSPISELIA